MPNNLQTAESPHHLGPIYKKMRESKGFTLKGAAGEDFPISTLSDFERGKSGLSVANFRHALDGINFSMLEFQDAYNRSLSSGDAVLYNSRVSDAYTTQNATKARQILDEVKLETEKYPEIKKFHLDKIDVEAALSLIDPNYHTPPTDIDFINKYLLTIKGWHHYEMVLLNHCNSILNRSSLPILAKSLSKNSWHFPLFSYNGEALIATLLNLIDSFTKRNQYDHAQTYISYLEDRNLPDSYMYHKIDLIYSKAHLAYRKKDSKALDTMKACLDVFTRSGCLDTADIYSKEIAELERQKG